MKKIDPETQGIISQTKLLFDFVNGDVWHLIKGKIMTKIMDLQSIKNLGHDGEDAQNIISEIRSRNAAVDILIEVVREIEGEASQYANNSDGGTKDSTDKKEEGEYIILKS
jgi:hypothetical protein